MNQGDNSNWNLVIIILVTAVVVTAIVIIIMMNIKEFERDKSGTGTRSIYEKNDNSVFSTTIQNKPTQMTTTTTIKTTGSMQNFNNNQCVLYIVNVDSNGETVVIVPVYAEHIENMAGFQFTIEYDSTKLELIKTDDWKEGISGVMSGNFEGKKTFVYADLPVTFGEKSRFFNLYFRPKANNLGNAYVRWSDSPTPREISNNIPEEISCAYSDGSVNT